MLSLESVIINMISHQMAIRATYGPLIGILEVTLENIKKN